MHAPSYASVAATNAPPPSAQPHPDPSLLEGHVHGGAEEPVVSAQELGDADKVHVVDASTADSLRDAISHADDTPAPADRFAAARDESRQVLSDAKADAAAAKKEASSLAAAAEKKGAEVEKDLAARARAAGKTVAEYEKELEKKGGEAYAKARKLAGEAEEEIEKAGREAAKKGKKWEKDARDAAKKYPAAASGLVGALNLAVLAGVGYAAYSNWDQPRWDRRTVSAVTIGLLGLFAGEGFLGYYEYEESKKDV